ncbi:hypothetical protein Vspart_01439 [Vibrio spartinae]|uniref:Uncharacterized protein n=1 Tax=Vibrio spartinae TaxID=1918945 RepID=A0ABX6QYV6_9VIBR|nr:hypothetical protein Vspart_01439 [Vibrio spartinae]
MDMFLAHFYPRFVISLILITYNKLMFTKNNLTKEKKVWNYFVFPNGDLMLIKQDICFMKEFYIDYYYSLSSNRKTVLNNYKNILNQLLQSELLTIRHGDLYSYLSKNTRK